MFVMNVFILVSTNENQLKTNNQIQKTNFNLSYCVKCPKQKATS